MKYAQRGATIIEFALVLLVFLTFLLGVIEFSRMLYTWNAATQAARVGARYAAVCDDGFHEAAVVQRMKQWLPQINDASVQWYRTDESGSPVACTTNNCEFVTVSIPDLNYFWLAPVPASFSRTLPMPSFTTSLRREVMRQDNNSPTICS